MNDLDMSLFYVTVPDQTMGKQLAKTLLKEGLIACANLFQPHTSLYMWNDEIQEEMERILILKTSKSKSNLVFQRLGALHPYDCPCIIEIDPSTVNKEFETWIYQHTRT